MTTTIPTSNDELQIVKLLAADHTIQFVGTAMRIPDKTVRAIGERYGYPDLAKLAWAVDELTRAQDLQARASIPPAEHATAARVERRLEDVPRLAATPQVVASLKPENQEPAMPEPQAELPAALQMPATAYVVTNHPVAGANDRLADLLERASRSEYKRTKALGTRIADLVDDLYERLDSEDADRRNREKVDAERQAALKELAAAEKALAAAREKARALNGKAPKTTTAKPAPVRTVAGDHNPKVVRAWAQSQGLACPAKGRVPRPLVDAWHNAQRRTA